MGPTTHSECPGPPITTWDHDFYPVIGGLTTRTNLLPCQGRGTCFYTDRTNANCANGPVLSPGTRGMASLSRCWKVYLVLREQFFHSFPLSVHLHRACAYDKPCAPGHPLYKEWMISELAANQESPEGLINDTCSP